MPQNNQPDFGINLQRLFCRKTQQTKQATNKVNTH